METKGKSLESLNSSRGPCQVIDGELGDIVKPSPANTIQNFLPEILCEIFSCCLPSDLSKPPSRVEPFNLSMVCKSWRDVVMGDLGRSMWSFLELKLTHDPLCINDVFPGSCRHPIHEIDTACEGQILHSWKRCLELSGDLPLDIDCEIWKLEGGVPAALAEVIRMKFEHQHRWRNCSLRLTTLEESSIISEIDRSLRLEFHIKSLLIRIHNGETVDSVGNAYHLDMPPSTPRLSSIMILGPTVLSQPARTRMENLTTLILMQIDSTTLIDMLFNAPNLETVKTGPFVDIIDESGGGDRKIILSKLRNLHLRHEGTHAASLAYLLKDLSTPSLTVFELESSPLEELSSTILWTTLKGWIERSRPPLIHLKVHARLGQYAFSVVCLTPRVDTNVTSDEALIGMLRRLAGLERLEIIGAIATNRLFEALARNRVEGDGGILCPLLEKVKQSKEGYNQFELRTRQEQQTAVVTRSARP